MADDAFVCFALLVFAFGSQFAHLRSNSNAQDPLASVSDPGRRFYEASQTLIPRVISRCTLKGIQVCLLIGLYNLPSNLPDTSYLYLGIAMRMAIASGLHRVTTAARLDERMVEVRNRLWWSLYCIDRYGYPYKWNQESANLCMTGGRASLLEDLRVLQKQI